MNDVTVKEATVLSWFNIQSAYQGGRAV